MEKVDKSTFSMFGVCFAWIWLFLVYKYTVWYSSQNSTRKVVFLGGPLEPPLGTKIWKYLGHLY